jgi:NAD(P)H-dependent flavin oxidoreductase YrpB (nitropropane dioxygenase family)
MLKTRFTDLVGCTVPIQQAGLGSFANPRLAAAVTNAGGLGMVSLAGLPADVVERVLDELGTQVTGPVGVNFLTPFVDPEEDREAIAAAASRARVIDFFYGDPDAALVEVVHTNGALACWQVGSLAEAKAAEAAGCDFIIAQGMQAGGHVRGTLGTLALLNQVLDTVKVPVLAAGGIGSGRSLAAVLAAGADGARVGTRFIAAEEAEAHPEYVSAVIAATADDTVYTDEFSGGWPDAPHRVLRASLEAARAFDGDEVGQSFNIYTGEPYTVERFQILSAHKGATGNIAAMPHWAGESVDGVKRVQPAAEIVRELAEGAEALLRRW